MKIKLPPETIAIQTPIRLYTPDSNGDIEVENDVDIAFILAKGFRECQAPQALETNEGD